MCQGNPSTLSVFLFLLLVFGGAAAGGGVFHEVAPVRHGTPLLLVSPAAPRRARLADSSARSVPHFVSLFSIPIGAL